MFENYVVHNSYSVFIIFPSIKLSEVNTMIHLHLVSEMNDHCVCVYFIIPAVVLAGHHVSGKTSNLSTVISICNIMHRHSSATVSTRLQRINPAVFDSLETLYGHINATGDWVDGVFTAALRKALKVCTCNANACSRAGY